MRQRVRPAAAVLAIACAAVMAGCGGSARSAPGATPGMAPGMAPGAMSAGTTSLATSLVTGAGTWAVAVMGGSAAAHDNFWQLFLRPAGSTTWKLVTPPGVASNGGLVLADAGGRALLAGIRPSQYLTYTPLTATRDGGQAWTPTGPLGGSVANVPDALSVAPATGYLLALLSNGTAKLAAPGYTSWETVASGQTLAATMPDARCGLRQLTAATVSASGLPLLAGTCSRPGIAGIFATRDGIWQPAGPPLRGALARRTVTVLRLTRTGNRVVALLKLGSAPTAIMLAASSADAGRHWALSPPLRLGRAELSTASFAPTGTIVLNATTADVIAASASGAWRALPAVPAGTATVAPGPAGGFDALAVHRTRLTVWRLGAGSATWRVVQVLNVPIQFGSSG